MEAFADRIYDETEGKYKIETYHNGQLGAEIDTIEGCQMGTIDIAVVNQSTIGNFINDFQALDIPYLITSTEQADAVFLGISEPVSSTSFPASSSTDWGSGNPVSAT